jgi:hypothetical protein
MSFALREKLSVESSRKINKKENHLRNNSTFRSILINAVDPPPQRPSETQNRHPTNLTF